MYRWLFALAVPAALMAQHDHAKMMADQQKGSQMNDTEMYLMNLASGTSVNPRSWPMPMIMSRAGSWNFMFMGQAFLASTQQSGPRGGDKIYSANWGMISAQRRVGRGSFMIQSMLSLEPATVTNRSYPLLLQTGETAYGRALVDAQHPHDFIMGLGIHYARPLTEGTTLHLYYAPVGDPALGPVAFPHRASAMELPQATLGHHWQDSTHIANNVATVGVRNRWMRLEASGFYGREPNEGRWNIDFGGMDSYSGRLSVFPAKNWMAQVSAGRLADPEPGAHGDVVRTTASVHYSRPMAKGTAWSSSVIWGRNHKVGSHHGDTQSFLVESVLPIGRQNWVTGRAEMADKDELFGHGDEAFKVKSYTAGYTRDVAQYRSLTVGVGANVTAYAIPRELQAHYGEHPWGATMFVRLRLKTPE